MIATLLALLACTSGSSGKIGSDDTDSSEDTSGTGDSGESGDSGDDSGGDSGGGDTAVAEDRFFPDGAPWYQDISDADVDPDSDAIIGALQSAGWGLGRFQIDFSLDVLAADASTTRMSFETTDDFYRPDCDEVPMPVPDGGNVEGESGYQCTGDGDCHLLVVDREESQLYEMWRANIEGSTFYGGCLAVWDMSKVYPGEGRGDQCTSADAAGYPIVPLLFTADEVAAGAINHAIRFALPNESIRDGEYYHPASHATNSGGGGATAVPYGARLRLKADFDVSRIENTNARVIVTALQTYGMVLADGGSVTLMGQADTHTTAKWDDLMDSHALVGIEPEDFELIQLDGDAIPLTFDCVRSE